MFNRRQYQMGSSAYTQAVKKASPEQRTQLMNTAATQTSNAKESLISGWNSLIGALSDPNVLGASQGVPDLVSQAGVGTGVPNISAQAAATVAAARTNKANALRAKFAAAKPSTAMALQRMSSGIGEHPGGKSVGKGAGGSLGKEARAARRAKRKGKGTPIVDDRVGKQEGGELDAQMADMMPTEEMPTHTMPDGTEMSGAAHEEYAGSMAEEPMIPDETMEEDFVDHIVESTLEPEDINYLEEALAADDRLSMIFDQIVETASEFSGSGPVEGPGSEVSDSIPARLSDGEFVITSKATEELGPDNLQGIMEQAEMDADIRREEADGGLIMGGEDVDAGYRMQQTVDPTERELRKLQLTSNPRTQYRTVYG